MDFRKRVLTLGLTILLLTLFAGCSSLSIPVKRTPKARAALTEGTIVVDRPEVSTFGRIVDDVHQDIQLLEKKLASYDSTGFQALREIRMFKAGSARTEIVQPEKAGNNGQPTTALPPQKAEPQQSPAADQGTVREEGAETSPPAAEPEAPVSPDIAMPKAVSAHGGELPNPEKLLTTKAALTPYERVLDELTYRHMIRAEQSSKIQDDSVALMGYTTYVLNFDITVIPGINTYTLGEAALSMVFDQSVSRDFYKRWQKQFQTDLVAQAFGIQRRWISGNLADSEKVTLQQYASQVQYQERRKIHGFEQNLQELENRQEELIREKKEATAKIPQLEEETAKLKAELTQIPQKASTLIARTNLEGKIGTAGKQIQTLQDRIIGIEGELTQNRQDELALQENIESARRRIENIDGFASDLATTETGTGIKNQIILCDIIQYRYLEDLSGLVTFLPHSRVNIDGAAVYFPQIDLAPDKKTEDAQFKRFEQLMAGLKLQPYIHSIEPRQYAQNISETTARNEITPDNRKALIIQHGISRKPLAVGYSRGATEFGWILGPRQEVDVDGNPLLRHLPIQYTFQVNVHVPAWFESIGLVGKYFWLNEDGSIGKGANIWNGEIEVKLPCEPRVITAALMKDDALHRPVILPPWDQGDDEDRFYVRNGQKATMMIRGKDLWRHPKVFLGTQRASSVEILPDLGGLLITFDAIHAPYHSRSIEQLLDLFVITSQGEAVLKDAVQILSEDRQTGLF